MKRILLVDDDDAFRKLLRLTLVKNGYEVTEACNGDEALAWVRNEERFDLLLVDLIMPEKEGIETIEIVCKKFPDLQVIAMSGGGRINASDYLEIATMMGANAVLKKPFSNEMLLQTVAKALDVK